MIVKLTSFDPCNAACKGWHPLLDMADDVLEHYNSVIHHQPDRKRDGQQRNIVEAVIENPHHCYGSQQ